MPTCESCMFFSSLSNECRYNPPTVLQLSIGDQFQFVGTFPPTKASNWCGKHVKREESPNG